jgi:DUF4097 and DUF4098 domain-containing protein YvlB
MDDNVMRVLQLLQDGKISAQEAEMLIAALRGESASPGSSAAEEKPKEEKDDKGLFGFEGFKKPKIDLDDLGERISKAVSKVDPEKIVRKVQTQIRTATRASAHWSSSVSQRVRTWTEGEDVRPTNPGGWAEHTETQEHAFHLEPGANVLVENPLGSVTITGSEESQAAVTLRKIAWSPHGEELPRAAEQLTVDLHGTDSRLDIKVSAPEFFRDGTVDVELRVPRSAHARVSTRFGEVEISGLEGRAEAVTTTGALHLRDLAGDARGETASGNIHLERIAGSATVATQSGSIHADTIGRGLSANAASGDVHAAGIEGGRVECKSVSGDALVERVGTQAPLDIVVESVSGDAVLRDASGNIALKAVSGDAKAENVAATRLQAQTVSGDVSVRLREAFSGTMQINTVSGDVHLALPEGSNVRVTLSTASGELRCEHDARDVTAAATLWTGQLGTGAGTLNVQTISGDTHLQRA